MNCTPAYNVYNELWTGGLHCGLLSGGLDGGLWTVDCLVD